MTFSDGVIFMLPSFVAIFIAAYIFRAKQFISSPKIVRSVYVGAICFALSFIWGYITLVWLSLGNKIVSDLFSIVVMSSISVLVGSGYFLGCFPKRHKP